MFGPTSRISPGFTSTCVGSESVKPGPFVRPIMSIFRSATTFVMSTDGYSTKYCDPHRPFSSPAIHRKMMLRFGRMPLAAPSAYARAMASSPVEPEPSSSAPLFTL